MKKLSKIPSVILCLAMVAGFFTFTASAEEATWTKVTTAPTDWSGTYLIVYEKSATEAIVLNSSLSSIDATANHVTLARSGNTITADTKYGFTIAAYSGGYSIKSSAGKYIYNNANSNQISSGNSANKNTISLNSDGSVQITGTGGAVLRFNSASGDSNNRFRYYKSSTYTNQKAIHLYKLDETPAGGEECDHLTAADPAKYGKDASGHWTLCTCGQQQVGEKSNGHSYGADHKCTVCEWAEPFPAVTVPTGTFLINYINGNNYATSTNSPYNGKDQLALGAKTAAAVFTAKDNGDGTVTFVSAGKFLYADGTHVRLVDTEGDNTKFVLEANGYEGECFIKCANATYNGNPQYLEIYSGKLTVFGMGNAIYYTFKFESYTCDHANAEWVKDAEKCSKVCPNCGEVTEAEAAHDYGTTGVCRCGTPYVCEHTNVEWTKDAVKHSKVCDCGETLVPEAKHTFVEGACECGIKHLGDFNIEQDGYYVTTEEYEYTSKSGNKKMELVMADDKAEAAVFSIIDNGDGTITFIAGGKFLYCNGNDVKFVTEEGEYTKFTAEDAGTAGAYFIKSSAVYSSKPQYLEVYSGYLTCFGMDSTKANIYTFTLADPNAEEPCDHADAEWTVTDTTCSKVCDCGEVLFAEAEHDFTNGDCRCGKEAPATGDDEEEEQPEVNTIVIGQKGQYVTDEEYEYTSKSGSKKMELVISDKKSDAAIFNLVENADGTVSFVCNGKYLYSNGTDVKLVTEESEFTKFVLETAQGGQYIRCATANYNGKPQYLEVYSGYLTVYGLQTDKADIYTFSLEDPTSPDTGDYTISVMVAALVLSGMGIVALTMKKKED